MAGIHNWLLSLAISLAATAVVQSQELETLPANPFGSIRVAQSHQGHVPQPLAMPMHTCKVYSLSDLGDDPKLCKWIAETIPEVIQPASWKQGEAKISFY